MEILDLLLEVWGICVGSEEVIRSFKYEPFFGGGGGGGGLSTRSLRYIIIMFHNRLHSGVARGGGGGGDICPRAQGFRGAKIDNLHR